MIGVARVNFIGYLEYANILLKSESLVMLSLYTTDYRYYKLL